MPDDGEDHEVFCKALRARVGWFLVRPVDSEEEWIARWNRGPGIGGPFYQQGGVIGTVEVNGVDHRVHVCA